MKISLFTRRLTDARRTSQLKEATRVAAEHGSSMLVLPGWSLGTRVTRGTALQKLARQAGLPILAEAGDTFCFHPDGTTIGPFAQRFALPAEATHQAVQQLAQGYLRGERTIHIEHKCVRVLLCGEHHILRNAHHKHNEAEPRHPDLGWDLKYDVLVNPCHTSTGQWGLLHKRFAYFSQAGRTFLFCANNTHASWGTALCVYRDGKLVTMGSLRGGKGLQTHIAEAWRLVTVDIP